MLDAPTNALKLVEYNTIASSLSSHCQRVREVQAYIIDKYADKISLNYPEEVQDELSKSNIEAMAGVFYRSCQLYAGDKQRKYLGEPQLKPNQYWVLFVIDNNERNICD